MASFRWLRSRAAKLAAAPRSRRVVNRLIAVVRQALKMWFRVGIRFSSAVACYVFDNNAEKTNRLVEPRGIEPLTSSSRIIVVRYMIQPPCVA